MAAAPGGQAYSPPGWHAGGYAPGFPPQPVATDPRAVGALVTSILALIALAAFFCLGIPAIALGALSFGLGISSYHRIDEAKGGLRGRTPAVAAMIMGVLAALLGFVFFFYVIAIVGSR